jgi:hypothetical protein
MPKTPKKKSPEPQPVQPAPNVREPLRDVFFLVAFAMGLFYSNRWFTLVDDEALTLSAAARPLGAVARFALGQHRPPLHDLLLHVWLFASGGAFGWLRVPSVLFFVAGAWLLSLAAKRAGGQASASALVLLFVVWPYGFHYGRLAAWYSFAFLLVSALTWAYLRFCDNPHPKEWTLVCLLALLLVYTSYFGWAILACLAVDDWLRHRKQPGTVRRLAVSATVLAAACAPLWKPWFTAIGEAIHPHLSLRAMAVAAVYNAYVLLVSESVAPWFWRLGVPAAIAVAICFGLAFFSAKKEQRRFLVFAAILFILLVPASGILMTRHLLLIAPWMLLPFATALGTCPKIELRRVFAVALLIAGGFGWFGVYKREYYATPRFYENWSNFADEAAGNMATGAGIISNNPSFFFYLTYALKVPPSPGTWRFAGALPSDVRAPNVWSPEDWIAAGYPQRPQMFWVRGVPGPDTGTPMAEAEDWLDKHCGDRDYRFMSRDPGYDLEQKYFPEAGALAWRIEIHQYSCVQAATPPALAAPPPTTPARR